MDCWPIKLQRIARIDKIAIYSTKCESNTYQKSNMFYKTCKLYKYILD